jgi:hypothetical protein
MSNLLTPVDSQMLEAVTGGGSTPRGGGSADDLLQTLTSLSNTIKDLGTNANRAGFSGPEMLMLGLLMSQRNSQVNVFVRRPFW